MIESSLKIILNQFIDAQIQFREALNLSAEKNTVIRDGTIQRFEFTFEICWKVLKRFLEREGISSKTPREAFQEAFKLGWLIEGDQFWYGMIKDRNLTSHTYSKQLAEEIYSRLESYHQAYEKLIKLLQSR